MKKKFLISLTLVSILIINAMVFAAVSRVEFSFKKYTLGLGRKQSISGIMTIYGHELDYDNFSIEDKTVIKFTDNGKSIEAVGTGITDLTYSYMVSNSEEKTISCHVEVNTSEPVPGTSMNVYYTVRIINGEYISETECKRGQKPVLPELKRDGYVFDGWYLDENFQKKYTLTWLQNDLTLYAKWKEAENEKPVVEPKKAIYSDIENHWAKGKIEYVTREKIFNGTGADKFSPDAPMTRAMVVTVLGRVAGVKAEGRKSSFVDVPAGAYYEEYVAWACENGIAKGVSDSEFNPNRNITREELAVMFANYIEYTQKEYDVVESTEFTDMDEISTWAVEAVKTLASHGVMKGNSENKFSPKALATRAEVSVVFYNFYMIKG